MDVFNSPVGTGKTGNTAWFMLWAVLLCTLMSGTAEARDGQFYFVARPAPDSSLTLPSAATRGVYLRWDTLEGQLPDDVAELRLLRSQNGGSATELLRVAADAVMSEGEIALLYRGEEHQRRLLETVARLSEYATSEERSFSTGAFASELQYRLENDRLWAYFASRADFNVARARYRAVLDYPGNGTFTYELQAINDVGDTARLGKVEVDTTASRSVLPPRDFRQVHQARCDAPEYARDHHTVSLQWKTPGAKTDGLSANITDQMASQVMISGYDLYRTTDNVAQAADRDIAAEARTAAFNGAGELELDGLEKVNDVLLTVTPDNADEPEWMETVDQLKRAGLEPGDSRGYYLVPRDFTGNYGPTLKTLVTVPDLRRPPQPWEVRRFVDQGKDDVAIGFDAVNLDNYLAAFGDSRKVCNLSEASASGVIEYVGPEQDCQTDTRRALKLDVQDYRVYRFDSFRTASRFRDSDGDGVSDSDERDAGTQCNAGAQPDGKTDYRLDGDNGVSLQAVTLPTSGRTRMRFRDTAPAVAKGKVHWYRFAAVSANGQPSLLTPPERALFPDRDLPAKPAVSVSRTDDVLSGCSLSLQDEPEWSFQDNVGRYNDLALNCGDATVVVPTSGLTDPDSKACASVRSSCEKVLGRTLTYSPSAGTGEFTCTVDVPDSANLCNLDELSLNPEYAEGQVPVREAGRLVSGQVLVSVTTGEPDTCVSLYQTLDGEPSRVATSCGSVDPGSLEYVGERGMFCGYAVAQDGNNNVSVPEVLPCTLVRPEASVARAPGTPQPVGLNVGSSQANISWRLPVEPVASVLAEVRHETGAGEVEIDVVSIPNAGLGSGDVQTHRIPVPALVGSEDRWCVSLRSVSPSGVGREGKSSGWSQPRCVTRNGNGTTNDPGFLPWPEVPPAKQGEPLNVHFGTELVTDGSGRFGTGAFFLFFDVTDISGMEPYCFIQEESTETTYDQVFVDVECNLEGLVKAQGRVAPELNMLVYRQARAADGTLGDWIQVSPVIEYAHWDDITPENPEQVKLDTIARLNDPYIQMHKVYPEFDQWRFVFTDRYPYQTGNSYRYQSVYFSEDGRIQKWRQSGWVTADTESLSDGLASGTEEVSP